MLESFGARLRRQREQHGIDLVGVAEQTKIKRSLLEALERDDLSQWPSGIFRRAYVRNYAQAIGLDADAVLQAFLQAHPEPMEVAALSEIASLADGARASTGGRLRTLVDSALGSFGLFRRQDQPSVGSGDTAAAAPTSGDGATPPVDDFERLYGAPADVPGPIAEAVASAVEMEEVPASPTAVHFGAAPPEASRDPELDLLSLAHLCTEFGRISDPTTMQPLLRDCVDLLEANGLIVWLWDMSAAGLRPALACGYPDKLLGQLPTVRRDADNATAEAFRSGRSCIIKGDEQASGALVVPLLGPDDCLGVLALEFRQGREGRTASGATAAIIAASLTQVIERFRPVEARVADDVPVAAAPAQALRTGTRH